jgi:hypothetical protein
MQSEFRLTDPPRPTGSRELTDLPTVTLTWRWMKMLYSNIAEEKSRQAGEKERLVESLVELAVQVYILKRFLRRTQRRGLPKGREGLEPDLSDIVKGMDEVLSEANIVVIAPEGKPYTTELMETLENKVQIPDATVEQPYVSEVITPTIMFGEEIKRLGKAVIRIPTGPSPNTSGGFKGGVAEGPDESGSQTTDS